MHKSDHVDTCECKWCRDARDANEPITGVDVDFDDRSLDQQWADLFDEYVD